MPKKETIQINDVNVDVYLFNTVIVGTGCAGFNAADSLHALGQHDIALVTEGVNWGTSRNTGSDKQTYYKLTLSGDAPDSVAEMAKTYFAGGCMHGDIALIEAALSARCFTKLAGIGVPFPHNKYGEYIGYKTDHDPRQRATSAGPLTSKFMTEKLQQQVAAKNIPIFDDFQVIALFTQESPHPSPPPEGEGTFEKQTIGFLTIDKTKTHEPNKGFTLFNCTNIIWATGGPAGMYADSVYPESQTGASGIAFEAGAKGINLTESQYGLASIKFRWNVSGTYQQVIPCYISTDQNGSDPQEFLEEYFPSPGKMMDAVFLKGYQWPFDPRKVENFGSSLIDILVYHETQIKNRRVWLDFRRNPLCSLCLCGEKIINHKDTENTKEENKLDFTLCGEETYTYLKNSNALFGRPIDRLMHMNQPAVQLYKDHGIDLHAEMLEIAVCAQHNNGGLLANLWSESNVKHLFPVGEASGVFGVYRPGGSALNSTQVSSLRAAQFIAANYTAPPLPLDEFANVIREQFTKRCKFIEALTTSSTSPLPLWGRARVGADHPNHYCPHPNPLPEGEGTLFNPPSEGERTSNITNQRKALQRRMTTCGAHIRSLEKIEQAITETQRAIDSFWKETHISSDREIPAAFKNWDILVTQYVYLCAVREYIRKGGGSRGSYLVQDKKGMLPLPSLPEEFRFSLDSGDLSSSVCEVELSSDSMECRCEWQPVRPIPAEENWFENIWTEYRKGNVIK